MESPGLAEMWRRLERIKRSAPQTRLRYADLHQEEQELKDETRQLADDILKALPSELRYEFIQRVNDYPLAYRVKLTA